MLSRDAVRQTEDYWKHGLQSCVCVCGSRGCTEAGNSWCNKTMRQTCLYTDAWGLKSKAERSSICPHHVWSQNKPPRGLQRFCCLSMWGLGRKRGSWRSLGFHQVCRCKDAETITCNEDFMTLYSTKPVVPAGTETTQSKQEEEQKIKLISAS